MQCLTGATYTLCGITATPYKLLGLGEKLDFTNAATTEFYDMAGHCNFSTAAMGVNLPFNRMDVLNCRKV